MTTPPQTKTKTKTSDMLLLHRMFRREFGRMPALISGRRPHDDDPGPTPSGPRPGFPA